MLIQRKLLIYRDVINAKMLGGGEGQIFPADPRNRDIIPVKHFQVGKCLVLGEDSKHKRFVDTVSGNSFRLEKLE
jgi:hypothetical protein